jgi:hypothetical protein
VRGRRRATTPRQTTTADEGSIPTGVELEQRIARVELRIERTSEELELTRQRLVALQAQLEHVLGRLGHF